MPLSIASTNLALLGLDSAVGRAILGAVGECRIAGGERDGGKVETVELEVAGMAIVEGSEGTNSSGEGGGLTLVKEEEFAEGTARVGLKNFTFFGGGFGKWDGNSAEVEEVKGDRYTSKPLYGMILLSTLKDDGFLRGGAEESAGVLSNTTC